MRTGSRWLLVSTCVGVLVACLVVAAFLWTALRSVEVRVATLELNATEAQREVTSRGVEVRELREAFEADAQILTSAVGDLQRYLADARPAVSRLNAILDSLEADTILGADAATAPAPMLAFHGSKGADSIAFSPDGRVLALVSDTLHLWDVLTDRELLTVPHKYAPVVFAPNGSVIAVQAAGSPAIELLEPETGKVVMTLIGHEMLATAMAFSPDSTLVASASYDGTVRVWDVVTGGEVRVLTLGMMDSGEGSVSQPRAAFSVSFSPDGSTLAAGSLDGIVRLWEARTWQEEAQLASHTACVAALAFSPDGRTLASGSWDNTVKLWDLATHSEVGSLSGHTKWISAVAFSPDGRTLASGSWDGTIKLWDPLTHIVLRTLSRHTSAVTALAFDRDGSVLATASASGEDGMVLLWDVSGR